MMRTGIPTRPRCRLEAGWSLIELVVVVAVILIVAAIAILQVQPAVASYRLGSAAQTIAEQIRQAQRAAETGFTHAQVVINAAAGTSGVQVLSGGAFAPSGPMVGLPSGVQFGFGPATAPPPGLGTVLAQQAPVLVNSQGRPIDGAGMPLGTYVVYLTNQRETYALNLAVTGRVAIWRYSSGNWAMR
jgi:prepilin-type N-terminal cleavage/methylation domain-containing protein